MLVAAHMGVIGGNIPGNTLASAEIALRQGADILEIDATVSADGELFTFHPGTEKIKLGIDCDLRLMAAKDIEKLPLLNLHGTPTGHHIPRLEEMLQFLRGRCIINIDKFQDSPESIARLVRRLGMQDQVIVKTNAIPALFDAVTQFAYDLPYMPFVYETDDCFAPLSARKDIRYIGAEVIFATEASHLASDEYIDTMHKLGKKIWVNAIVFDEKRQLAAGHSDDLSICDSPAKGWGWLAHKGYDMIQTDWPLACSQYLRQMGH